MVQLSRDPLAKPSPRRMQENPTLWRKGMLWGEGWDGGQENGCAAVLSPLPPHPRPVPLLSSGLKAVFPAFPSGEGRN